MSVLLSILIPTVVGREVELERLLNSFSKTLVMDVKSNLKPNEYNFTGTKYDCEEVEVIVVKDDKSTTIGEKREFMYKLAKGAYSIQVDEDDLLSDNAIELILEAIKSNSTIPCINFKEKCIIDGVYFSSNFSIKYDDWQDDFDGFSWVRNTFYKSVIRTDLAQSVPFEKIRFGEDRAFSNDIKHLLTDEIYIDQEIYHYIHNSTPHHERYGFDKD